MATDIFLYLIPVYILVLGFLMFWCCCRPKNWGLCCLSFFHWCYHCCTCCRFDCTSRLSPNVAISRYEEDPPPNKDEFISSVLSNEFIKLILNGFSLELPEYFLSILPTGSLREGFGKMLPSTAVLASDYDVMIVPDAVSVADEDCKLDEKPVFAVVESPVIRTGFVWLRLENAYLKQWEDLCIRRQTENKGCSYLSSHKIHDLLRAKFFNTDKMREKNVKIKSGSVEITVEQNGPALTVKIADKAKTTGCCGFCSQLEVERENLIFYCDFTFGLHCVQWPRKSGWFNEERRHNRWPSPHVVDEIRKVGCHVVPKPSTDSLIKLHEEQPLNTTYSQSPGLEWRYSFSQPEILLAENVEPAARSAYIALKAVNKRHISKHLEKGLPSYTLKCLLFRFMEEKDASFWETNPDPIDIFVTLLDSLHLHIVNGFLPHYWIEEINLIEDLDQATRTWIQSKIVKVRANPQAYIADNWLEHTRCFRYNCCVRCGGEQKKAVEQIIVIPPDPPNPCCLIPMSYTKTTCCCGPCPSNRVNIDVY